MEKHILNLLNTNLRVIIPDFGAFIIRQKEPLVLVFNEFLRYNDGLLIDYIAKNEDIDKDMAKHQVAEFTENLVKVLESGKEVKLLGIGTLRRTGDDKIEFIQTGKETPKRSTKKVQEKKQDESAMDTTVPLEILPEEPGVTSKPVSDSKTKTGKSNDAQPAKSETRPETAKSTKAEPAKADTKAHEKKPVSNGSAKKTAEQPKPDLQPKDIERPPVKQNIARTPVSKAPLTREKSNKKQPIGWIILIVIVVALINAWFIFNDPIKNFFSTHKLSKPVPDTLGQVVEVDTETAAAAVAADTAAKFQEVLEDDFYVGGETAEKAPVVVTAKSAVSGEKRYYIVAGCFRDEINAQAMVKELNGKGYKAEKFGTIGNLHAVSYSSFTNKEKAQKELERIRKEVAPEAWMVYY